MVRPSSSPFLFPTYYFHLKEPGEDKQTHTMSYAYLQQQPPMEPAFPLEPAYRPDPRFAEYSTSRRRRVVSAPYGSCGQAQQTQGVRKAAHRRTASDPPVVKSQQFVRPDVIDRLDNSGFMHFHHEGPYDAVKPERNVDSESSPIAAVQDTNSKALEATAPEKIVDSINNHRPLDGTAFYPPGTTDAFGYTYDYEEGPNMMNDYGTNSGNFARCPGQVGHFPPPLFHLSLWV